MTEDQIREIEYDVFRAAIEYGSIDKLEEAFERRLEASGWSRSAESSSGAVVWHCPELSEAARVRHAVGEAAYILEDGDTRQRFYVDEDLGEALYTYGLCVIPE